jgi:Cu2+-containing amine oxidase
MPELSHTLTFHLLALVSRHAAAYGAEDLSQANTVYLDSHWGLGASVRELVQGIDCPMTAAFMDAVTYFKGSGTINVHKNAICVFEHNPGECCSCGAAAVRPSQQSRC